MFRKNDRIVVVCDDHKHYSRMGTVVGQETDSEGRFEVELDDEDGNNCGCGKHGLDVAWFHAREIEFT